MARMRSCISTSDRNINNSHEMLTSRANPYSLHSSRQTTFLLAQWHFSQAIPSSSTNPWKKRILEPRLAGSSASQPCWAAVLGNWQGWLKKHKVEKSPVKPRRTFTATNMCQSAWATQQNNFGVWLDKRHLFLWWLECWGIGSYRNVAHKSKTVNYDHIIYVLKIWDIYFHRPTQQEYFRAK